jgi:hypothetical protein
VRLEIESALKRDIPVVPVLVDNARMPAETDLPDSLRSLAYRHAAELRPGRDLQHHINILTLGIQSKSNAASAAGYADAVARQRADYAQPAVKEQPFGNVDSDPAKDAIHQLSPSTLWWKLGIPFTAFLTIGIVLYDIALDNGPTADVFGYSSFFFFGGAGLIAIAFASRIVTRLTKR